MRTTRPIAERFWEKVDIRGPDECWPWLAYRTPQGYGTFQVGTHANKKSVGAHVLAWKLANGCELPDGKPEIAHATCHNPTCCNPAHLAPASRLENERQKTQSGRRPKVTFSANGELATNAILTAANVREIRKRWQATPHKYGLITSLSREFGVCTRQIYDITRGRSWKGE